MVDRTPGVAGVFKRNGWILPSRARKLPVIQRFCTHLGKAINETVSVPCVSCGGEKEVRYRVYKCDVYGKCLPTYKGDVKVEPHLCGEDRCESYNHPVS